MKAVMVKHTNEGKVFWFEAPEPLCERIEPGIQVVCDTVKGRQYGFAVSAPMELDDVRETAAMCGAKFPLRKILAVARPISMDNIKIPDYMKNSPPSDQKIAKRLLEFYHTGQFRTFVSVRPDGTLIDGYTAYLVAKRMELDRIYAVFVKDLIGGEGND